MTDKGRITSLKLWPEDEARIEALKQSIEARVPGTVRVSTNSVIRAALASAVAAMPAGMSDQNPPLFTVAIEPVNTSGRPGNRVSVKRRKRKPKTSREAESPAAAALQLFKLDDDTAPDAALAVQEPPPAPAKPAKRKRQVKEPAA
jgi:hypothetical protein